MHMAYVFNQTYRAALIILAIGFVTLLLLSHEGYAQTQSRLVLVSLHCEETEDTTGADEPYILVNGNRVWGPGSLNDNDTVDLSKAVNPIAFANHANIQVWDQDTGAFDDDDKLGDFTVSSEEVAEGDKSRRISGDGSKYTLFYRVEKQ